MIESNTIENILVVGGGTAGWMAAAYLRRRTGCAVTLVESPTIDTIGVGEATIPTLLDFLGSLNLDEDEFMRRCNATYKLGIKFINWISTDHVYWHPFGLVVAVIVVVRSQTTANRPNLHRIIDCGNRR